MGGYTKSVHQDPKGATFSQLTCVFLIFIIIQVLIIVVGYKYLNRNFTNIETTLQLEEKLKTNTENIEKLMQQERKKRDTSIVNFAETNNDSEICEIISQTCRSQTGFKGEKGDVGFTGAPGLDGDPGIPGWAGPPGLPGLVHPPEPPTVITIKGEPGDKGEPGIRGYLGPPGAIGPKGKKGDSADDGMYTIRRGVVGPPGPPGRPGRPGPKGDRGYPGSISSPEESFEIKPDSLEIMTDSGEMIEA